MKMLNNYNVSFDGEKRLQGNQVGRGPKQHRRDSLRRNPKQTDFGTDETHRIRTVFREEGSEGSERRGNPKSTPRENQLQSQLFSGERESNDHRRDGQQADHETGCVFLLLHGRNRCAELSGGIRLPFPRNAQLRQFLQNLSH